MKREKIVTALVGFCMACLLSFAAMGAMISALDLPVANMAHLHTAWILAALAGCILFSYRKGWLPALLIAVVGIVYLWEYHYLSLPIRALITRLSWIYDSAYGWGILEFAGVNWRETDLDLILGTWGCLIALTTAGTVVGGRGQFFPLVFSLLPFCSTVVVTNTPVDASYVFAMILGVVLLLLPATVRQHSPGQGAKLTLMTALPVGLVLAVLFAACPQDTYVNHSQDYLNEVVSWWQSGVFNFQGSSGPLQQTVGPSGTTTNLRRVGPRSNSNVPVMEVTSSAGGTIYLRGQDYDTYTGTDWIAGASRNEEFSGMYPTGDIVTVKTRRAMNVIYLPYYPETEFLTGGKISNDENLTEYLYPIYKVPAYWKAQAGGTLSLGTAVIVSEDVELEAGIGDSMTSEEIREQLMLQRFTALPIETQQWAEDYVNRNLHIYKGNFPDHYTAANRIAGHVRQSALYNKNTPRMDGDDFARWFLEESDTGYCVHFATATAVLLRSVGIPARYVTGYMTTCAPHEATTVTANQAHAWVEYYDPHVHSWIPLEATPPDFTETETEAPTQTEPTESATEAPTEDATEAESRPGNVPRPGVNNTPKPDLKPLWTVLKWAAGIALAWALVLVQYRIRRKLARQGSPNTRALHKWQSVALLCRVTKQTPPEELEDLAQKAKFSQYTLTAEELRAFDDWLDAKRTKPMPWYLGFVCKYVLALW